MVAEMGRLTGEHLTTFSRWAITVLVLLLHNSWSIIVLKDVAKVVQEKYFERAEGDFNFNMIVLAGKSDDWKSWFCPAYNNTIYVAKLTTEIGISHMYN